ncbi:MAG: 3'-5' exonuclease [Gemmatimonadota bacterium]|nr:MAG: 3'-5' exonuclease [Gemmatimonadota bacterium]
MNGALGVRWDDLPLLRDRAVSLLLSGPARTHALAERIFSIRHGPPRLTAPLVREVLGADPRFQVRRDRWVLTEEPATYGDIPLSDVDFVVVDVESTGGSPRRGDRVTEVAAVRMRNGEIVECFESLVNPERPIPPSVSALTNITEEMVADAPKFRELLDPLKGALRGAVFVAHNVGFDWRFLDAEFRRSGGGRLEGERLCTLRLARRLHPELRRRSLAVLTDYYAIPVESHHRAGADARATAELFTRFLSRLGDEGVEDWTGLQRYLKPARRRKKAKRRKKRNGDGGTQ